jgi:hypothetical protein
VLQKFFDSMENFPLGSYSVLGSKAEDVSFSKFLVGLELDVLMKLFVRLEFVCRLPHPQQKEIQVLVCQKKQSD